MRKIRGDRQARSLGLYAWEQIGRRWGTWEDMDDRKRWEKSEKDAEGYYMVDLVETFYSNTDLR